MRGATEHKTQNKKKNLKIYFAINLRPTCVTNRGGLSDYGSMTFRYTPIFYDGKLLCFEIF